MRGVVNKLTTWVIGAVLVVSSAATAGDQDPGQKSAEDRISYAVANICAPFVLDRVDPKSRPAWFESDGSSEPVMERMGLTRVRSGSDGAVYVGVNAISGNRDCEIVTRHADSIGLRAAALRALAKRTERFAPTKSKYLPGGFAMEDMLCAAPGSRHPGGFVMMSAAHPEDRDRVAVLFSMNDAPRQENCDHDGVKLHFRALAPATVP